MLLTWFNLTHRPLKIIQKIFYILRKYQYCLQLTSSLYSLRYSLGPGCGETNCIWPVVKPTSRGAPVGVAVVALKSWQLGFVPL